MQYIYILRLFYIFSVLDSNPGNAAVHIVSQWLVCVYRSLDALQDNSAVLQELRQYNMIYLVNGNLVSLKNTAVFYPLNDDEKNPQKRKSEFLPPCKSECLLSWKSEYLVDSVFF